jgi:hypothetical protein
MAWEKKTSMKAGVVPFTVRVNGKIDQLASERKFSEVLTQTRCVEEATDDVVLGAIHSFFEQYKGACVNVMAITSGVVQAMGRSNKLFSEPQLFSTVSKRVSDVLEQNTEPKVRAAEDTKVYSFDVRRGPGGGHYRVIDQAK